jgi:hypothetical protein
MASDWKGFLDITRKTESYISNPALAPAGRKQGHLLNHFMLTIPLQTLEGTHSAFFQKPRSKC